MPGLFGRRPDRRAKLLCGAGGRPRVSANPAAERIRRSVLFVPGDRPDRIPKALASGADTVVLDLEDAVGPGEKAKARRDVADALASPAPAGSKVERVVRVNPPGTDVQAADLAALLGLHLDAVMVPKVERAATIARRTASSSPTSSSSPANARSGT